MKSLLCIVFSAASVSQDAFASSQRKDPGNFGYVGEAQNIADELYRVDIDELHSKCKFAFDDAQRVFPSLIVSSFRDTQAYDDFDGTDHTPHNLHNYPEHSYWKQGLQPTETGTLQAALCEMEGQNGEENWSVMRVGPFISRGGYDWWQFAGHDMLNLSRHLHQGMIGLQHTYVAAVSAKTGRTLPYPPMHVHHFHLVPKKSYLRYQWPMAGPFTKKDWKYLLSRLSKNREYGTIYVPNYVAEQHGEWDTCNVHPTRKGCFAESLPKGHAKLIDFSMDFEGELNDNRETNAPPIEWYLEVGVGWTHNVENVEPVSYGVLVEDHLTIAVGYQHTYENYYYVPTDKVSINYYEGKMPTSGELLRAKHHDHMSLFRKTYLISATALELNLTAKPLFDVGGGRKVPMNLKACPQILSGTRIEKRCSTVIPLSQIGFKTLDEFEAMLLRHIDQLEGGRNRIICVLERGLTEIGEVKKYPDWKWDRMGNPRCNPWHFQEGSSFTSVVLHEMQQRSPGPWAPGPAPKILPMHNQWNILYKSTDGASNYFLYTSVGNNAVLSAPVRQWLWEELVILNWRMVHKNSDALTTWVALRAQQTLLRMRQGILGLLAGAALTLLIATLVISTIGARKVYKRLIRRQD